MFTTTTLDVPNSRSIARQLLELSQDVDSQPYIVAESGCVAGLVSYLNLDDMEVCMTAARTLQFLSSHPQNKRGLKEFPGLVEALMGVYTRRSTNARAKEFAFEALDNLGVSVPAEEEEGDDLDEAGEKENSTMRNNMRHDTISLAAGKYHTLTLQVEGLDNNYTASLAQRLLVNTPGVISVSIDKSRGLAVIGTRGDNSLFDRLTETLANAGLSSSPWPPVAKPADSSHDTSATSDDSGYLNEADYEPTADGSAGAISKWGMSSLEARLEAQRREEEARNAKTEHLLTKVGSLVSSASSWLLGW